MAVFVFGSVRLFVFACCEAAVLAISIEMLQSLDGFQRLLPGFFLVNLNGAITLSKLASHWSDPKLETHQKQ